jgi:hypothetical protein
MSRASQSLASVVMGVLAIGGLAAQAPATNLKLGLWDLTITLDMPGMPGMDMSGMSEAEKAQMAAIMRGRGMAMAGGMPTMTMKTCMTADKVAKGQMAPPRPGQECTSKVTKSSATTLDYIETCTGAQNTTSEMHLEASSPTSMKMTGKTTTSARGRGRGQAETATVTITGTWVADACGDVK